MFALVPGIRAAAFCSLTLERPRAGSPQRWSQLRIWWAITPRRDCAPATADVRTAGLVDGAQLGSMRGWPGILPLFESQAMMRRPQYLIEFVEEFRRMTTGTTQATRTWMCLICGWIY